VWLVLALGLTAVLTANNRGDFAPTNASLAAPSQPSGQSGSGIRTTPEPITGATPCEQIDPSYPCLRPELFALDTLLPPGTGSQASAWRIVDSGSLAWALTALKSFAWVATVLLLAGFTGLLRKT
jgi:hypothetical protein